MKKSTKAALWQSLKIFSSYYNGYQTDALKKRPIFSDDILKKIDKQVTGNNKASLASATDLKVCKRCTLWVNVAEFELPKSDNVKKGSPAVILLSPPNKKEWELIQKMLAAISLKPGVNCLVDCIVKCNVPKKQLVPSRPQVNTCIVKLVQRLKEQNPGRILCLGQYTTMFLTGIVLPLSTLRKKVCLYNNQDRVLTTYSASDLLNNPSLKRFAWEDLQKFKKEIATAV